MVTTGWHIDPETLSLTNPDVPPHHAIYTAEEFAAQQWPPCPVCGTTVEVDQIDITFDEVDERRNGRTYIAGLWVCPRGCNPITGQRHHASHEFGQDINGLYFHCSCGISGTGLSREELDQLREEHRFAGRA